MAPKRFGKRWPHIETTHVEKGGQRGFDRRKEDASPTAIESEKKKGNSDILHTEQTEQKTANLFCNQVAKNHTKKSTEKPERNLCEKKKKEKNGPTNTTPLTRAPTNKNKGVRSLKREACPTSRLEK